jgi:hypothetical protein
MNSIMKRKIIDTLHLNNIYKKFKSTKPKQPKSSEEANGSDEERRYAVM